ncbi:MAG: hypothetical protein R2825_03735 [Saprospiraceae bacterium]
MEPEAKAIRESAALINFARLYSSLYICAFLKKNPNWAFLLASGETALILCILSMSDFIKHECGVALIRLLKPIDHYLDKYGTTLYGLNKLQLLMEKQRNRGQDGAGIATVKLQGKARLQDHRPETEQRTESHPNHF